MTYASTDPRSQLTQAPAASADPEQALEPQCLDFHTLPQTHTSSSGGRTWVVRAANVVMVYAELADGDEVRRDDSDETMLLVLPSDGRLHLRTATDERTVTATSLVTISPGTWSLTSSGDTRVVRLHTLSAHDLLEQAHNREAYAGGLGNAAVATPWPAPTRDCELHVYESLEAVPPEQGRMGRIYRGRHAMVNVLYPRVGPRDPRTLSPHTHDDFEQLSFVDEGRYVHHVRREWGSDRTLWKDDVHVEVGGPSVMIIPPPLVHTSEAVGPGENRMVDIFAGPRADFSSRPGWVLNAEDYPAPLDGDLT